MKSDKRGQATIFIILGVIIFIILMATLAVRSGTVKKSTISEIVSGTSFSTRVESVEDYVDGCLDDVTWEAINTYAGTPMGDSDLYREKIKDFIEGSILFCTDFTDFEDLTITGEEVRGVKVEYADTEETTLYIEMDYYLLIKKGDKSATLSKINKEVKLAKTCCVPIPVNNYNDCKATESTPSGGLYDPCSGFTYHYIANVDYVTTTGTPGGDCLAC